MVSTCAPAVGAAAPAPPPATYLAGQAVLQLTLPAPTPVVGPPPSVNQWKSAFVGYPLWFWTTDKPTDSAAMTVLGYPVTLTATRTSVSFDMGDGHTISCTTATPWTSDVAPGSPSPDCGYTYSVRGQYTITATASWDVTWSALGQTGVIPMTQTASTALPVGELQSVNTVAGGATTNR